MTHFWQQVWFFTLELSKFTTLFYTVWGPGFFVAALVLDLSDFATEDIPRAFAIWKSRITRDPSVWNEGFQLALAVEAFRSLIQKYGEDIVSVFRETKAKKVS